MIFESDKTFLIRNIDTYNLCRNTHNEITNGDFTFSVKIKPNFDVELDDTNFHRGYVISKNGMHIGIHYTKSSYIGEDIHEIGCSYSINFNNETIFKNIGIKIYPTERLFKVSMIHNIENKTISLCVDDEMKTETYDGDLFDYTTSWLWVGSGYGINGASNPFSYYYNGEMKYAGIFKKELSISKINEILDNEIILNYTSEHKTIFVTNFEEKTNYKIKDLSNNGNHLLLYDEKWV